MTPVAPIAHPVGGDDVILQIGSYDLGDSNVDGFVIVPTFVLYGDGTAYRATVDDSEIQTADLGEEAIQSLLSVVREGEDARTFGAMTADDLAPLLIQVLGTTWTVYEATEETQAYVAQVMGAFAAAGPTAWTPVHWYERPLEAECRIVATPTAEPWYRAPVLPHLVSSNPLGGACVATPR
jgi:hypothetical protein